MIKVNFLQAIDKDFMDIYGYIPENPYVAFNCFINNKLAGIGGYVENGINATLFLNIFDDSCKITIAKILMTELYALKKKELKFNVIRDLNEPKSEIFLQKLGFMLSYKIDNNEIWELTNESNAIQ